MKEEDTQAILKLIGMRDLLVDASRCRDLRDDVFYQKRITAALKRLSISSHSYMHSPPGNATYISSLAATIRAYIVILLRKKLVIGQDREKRRNHQQPKRERPAVT